MVTSLRFRILLMVILAMGVFFAPGVAHGQEGATHYTVQPGDTLLLIAQHFHVPMELLAQANGIQDPNLIQVGQTLVIPDAGMVAQAQVQARLQEMAPALARTWRAEGMWAMAPLIQALGWPELSHLAPWATRWAARDAHVPPPLLQVRAPTRIVQGRTATIRITSLSPIPPAGRFQNRDLFFLGEGQDTLGYHFVALIPTGALDKPGDKSLTLRIGPVTWQVPITILAGVYETQHIVLPPSKGKLLAPDKLKAERERLYALWARISGPPRWSQPFRFPIAEGFPRTSPYGTRRSYNGGPVASFHAGSDWGAPEGEPILAPAPGVVVLAENLFVRGDAVILDHGAGVYSNFWHMSRIDVHPGDVVQAGDTLGLVGNTGLSTGAHLHWEVRVNTVAVDPMQWTQTPPVVSNRNY